MPDVGILAAWAPGSRVASTGVIKSRPLTSNTRSITRSRAGIEKRTLVNRDPGLGWFCARENWIPWASASVTALLAPSHPISPKSCIVRSTSEESELLIAGSIKRFGSAETSQWETEDPGAYGLGAYISACPAASVPAFLVGSSRSLAFIPARFALRNAPSDWLTRTEGIVIEGSLPARPAGGQPGTLSATTTPIAPASWAFLTLTVNVQPPRSRSTIFPPTT